MILFYKKFSKFIILLTLVFSLDQCSCEGDPCRTLPGAYAQAVFFLLFPPTPPFSGSCTLQNDCIDFKDATFESVHANICNYRGGIYKSNIQCDLTGKQSKCSLLQQTGIFRSKYYYDSSWNGSSATDHCQNQLKGVYSNL